MGNWTKYQLSAANLSRCPRFCQKYFLQQLHLDAVSSTSLLEFGPQETLTGINLSYFRIMEPVIELGVENEIARKILAKERVSDEEFRYAVLFNLTAMTQLLWELSNNRESAPKRMGRVDPPETSAGDGQAGLRGRARRLVPLAAIVAFLVGLGLGFLIP